MLTKKIKSFSFVHTEGNAEVSKFNVNINGIEEKNIKIDLIPTNKQTLDNKIAPGTSGNFEIKIDASKTNETIRYNVEVIKEENKPTNLKFICDNKQYNSLKELESILQGEINNEEKIKIYNIEWKWEYETGTTKEEIEENDLIDTNDMKNINNYIFLINVKSIQV